MKTTTNGSKIAVQAAIDAGIGFFAGYPITPAAKILEYMADLAGRKDDLVFLQSEDEISALHNVIGASLGGKKAMTATSGPGFSLMQEGLGLAFASRVPLVLINVMRVGPSTGMPTKASQQDLLATQYGPHGDYKSIVFYPNSLPEIYEYIIKAFDAAEKCSSPVIVLLDAVLANIYETIDIPGTKKAKTKRHTLRFGKSSRHLSGLVTDSKGIPQTNSYDTYDRWITKRIKKIVRTASDFDCYEYKKGRSAKTLIISFGFLSRLIPESPKYRTFRPIRLFPVSDSLKRVAKRYKKIIVVEANQGQYAYALRSELQREIQSIKITRGFSDPDKILRSINEKV